MPCRLMGVFHNVSSVLIWTRACELQGCSIMENIIVTIILVNIELTDYSNDYFGVWKRDAFIQHFSTEKNFVTENFKISPEKNKTF